MRLNPKPEARTSSRLDRLSRRKVTAYRILGFSDFGFLSGLGFRISDFSPIPSSHPGRFGLTARANENRSHYSGTVRFDPVSRKAAFIDRRQNTYRTSGD